ncbi:unnamed protein product [Urochloa humidicola]
MSEGTASSPATPSATSPNLCIGPAQPHLFLHHVELRRARRISEDPNLFDDVDYAEEEEIKDNTQFVSCRLGLGVQVRA